MINFENFTQEKEIIVPITQGAFQYNRKFYQKSEYSNHPDGWYRALTKGNDYQIVTEVVIEMENIPFRSIIKGYTLNNQIIFQNFDVARRKWQKQIMSELRFNTASDFSSIEAIVWEDNQIYYYKPNYNDILIHEVKGRFEQSESIVDLKRITPELKTVFLFHELEKQKIIDEQKRILEQIKRKQQEQELEKLKKTLQGRLMLAFNRVGATLIQYSVSGNRIIVDWKLQNSSEQFNSVIDCKTFRVIEAGYCMSGDDRRHNISSMVLTAKDYDDDGDIYITRD